MPTLIGHRLNLAQVRATATATSGVDLRVKRWQLTQDRSSSPFVLGTFVCALPAAADLASIDPRAGVVLAIDPQQSLDAGVTWTSISSGPPAFGGTGAHTTPPFPLMVRARSVDYVAGEMTIEASSFEGLLDDYAKGTTYDPGSSTFQAAIVYACAQANASAFTGISNFLNLDGSPSNPATAAGTQVWGVGQTALDYVQQLAELAGAWFYYDLAGNARYSAPASSWPDTSTHYLDDSSGIVSVVDRLDRNDPLYGNFALITFNGDSPPSYVTFDTAGTPRKVIQVSRVGKNYGGAVTGASAIAYKAAGRGRSLQVTAIADLTARPNQTWQVTYAGVVRTGTLRAVTWRIPEGLMDMTIDSGGT